jgi:peptidoglycan biosynthesis protein MviN/MurJ (putative lipid II flippase)
MVIGVVYFFGLPLLLSSSFIGLSDQTRELTFLYARPLSILLPLGFIVALLSTWTMVTGRHTNSLIEAVPAATIFLALILPPGLVSEPLIWGTVAGVSLQMVVLGIYLKSKSELSLPKTHLSSPVWPLFWSGIGVMSLGQLLASLTGIADQFFAAGLSPGSLANLNYANRITSLVLGMGATAISRATLPAFSLAIENNGISMNALAIQWAKWMFFAGVLIAVIGSMNSYKIVELLFEHGKFISNDTTDVSRVLSYSLLQVPFFFGSLVLVSALGARGQYSIIAYSGCINIISKITISLFMVKEFEIIGLPLSTAAMYAISMVYLYAHVGRKIKKSSQSA